MSKNIGESIESFKKELGRLIADCRGAMSQRKLASLVGLPPSNMKYIEDGVNAPSPEIYAKIINALNPDQDLRKTMDHFYTAIRKIPPPDICDMFVQYEEMIEVMRIICGQNMSESTIEQIRKVFNSLTTNNGGQSI
ncbi:MAG: hypothetical protein IJE25_04490 [Clostridia bacterium]|nr:hypothetical protein [Clostridia bacterium]